MSYELSAEQAEIIRHYVDVFMGDARVRIVGNHVQLYVAYFDGSQRYIEDLGWFDDPRMLRDAVLENDAWKNRNMYSPANSVRAECAKLGVIV